MGEALVGEPRRITAARPARRSRAPPSTRVTTGSDAVSPERFNRLFLGQDQWRPDGGPASWVLRSPSSRLLRGLLALVVAVVLVVLVATALARLVQEAPEVIES